VYRLPLVAPSADSRDQIRRVLRELGLATAAARA
jgi:hypothetical protein